MTMIFIPPKFNLSTSSKYKLKDSLWMHDWWWDNITDLNVAQRNIDNFRDRYEPGKRGGNAILLGSQNTNRSLTRTT